MIAPSRPWPGPSTRPKATAPWQDDPPKNPRQTPRTAPTCRKHTWYDAFGNRIEKKIDSNGDGGWETTQRYALDGWKTVNRALVGNEN